MSKPETAAGPRATIPPLSSPRREATEAPPQEGGGLGGIFGKHTDERGQNPEQAQLDKAVLPSFLRQQDITLGGVKCRPITTATIAMLKEIDSPFIMGVPIAGITNPFLDACMVVVLQSAERTAAQSGELAENRRELKRLAYELADTLPAQLLVTDREANVFGLVDQVINAINSSMVTRMIPQAPVIPGEKKKKKAELKNS